MGSGLVNATAWRVTRRRSLWGAAETACNSNSTVRRVVSKKRDAERLKAVRRDRRLFRRAFFQIKRANFMVESYHLLQPQRHRDLRFRKWRSLLESWGYVLPASSDPFPRACQRSQSELDGAETMNHHRHLAQHSRGRRGNGSTRSPGRCGKLRMIGRFSFVSRSVEPSSRGTRACL